MLLLFFWQIQLPSLLCLKCSYILGLISILSVYLFAYFYTNTVLVKVVLSYVLICGKESVFHCFLFHIFLIYFCIFNLPYKLKVIFSNRNNTTTLQGYIKILIWITFNLHINLGCKLQCYNIFISKNMLSFHSFRFYFMSVRLQSCLHICLVPLLFISENYLRVFLL